MKRELILASQSPRRRELLERCHVPFRIEVADIDEALNPDIPLEAAMEELAWRKAHTVFVFKPEGYDRTFAELGNDIKNQISHRALAVQKLCEFLQS